MDTKPGDCARTVRRNCDEMFMRAAVAACAVAAAAAISITRVYEAYQPGQPECYRQPILLSLPQPAGTLLAFAEVCF